MPLFISDIKIYFQLKICIVLSMYGIDMCNQICFHFLIEVKHWDLFTVCECVKSILSGLVVPIK